MSSIYSLNNAAFVQEFTIAQPAAGVDWSYTVPAGQFVKLETLFLTFTASAVVATRQVRVQITDGTNAVWSSQNTTAGVLASQNITLTGARLGPDDRLTGNGVVDLIFLPDVWLPASYTIGSVTASKDVGDQYSAVRGLLSVSSG